MTQLIELPNYKEIRRLKISAYAERQSKRTVADKENDSEVMTAEYQEEWLDRRTKRSARSWERWDGMIEEWTPWNRYGEPINQWRYYSK